MPPGYIERKEVYPVSHLHEIAKPHNPIRNRLQVFIDKGLTCVVCGITADKLALERHEGSKRYHYNLYASHKSGREVMLTVDHIIPKSRGGSNNPENLQPMCRKCNSSKGNDIQESDIPGILGYNIILKSSRRLVWA